MEEGERWGGGGGSEKLWKNGYARRDENKLVSTNTDRNATFHGVMRKSRGKR